MEKKLVARVLDWYITTKCTLNCKLCMTAVPYVLPKNSANIPVADLTVHLEKFFDVYDYAKRIEFMGGEPLVHPQLCDIIRATLLYKDRFDTLRITTNATIVPSDELCELIASCGKPFDFVVDNYGELSRNMSGVKAQLEKHGIPYRVDLYTGENQHFGGWVKCGDYQPVEYTDEQLHDNFVNCVQVKDEFACTYNGRVYQCPYQATFWITQDREISQPDEFVDLMSDELTREQKREIVSGFYKTPITACHYCYGFDEKKSKRYPAAEQVGENMK
jgi:MoaA/NifB/PqqE/SkfB family radical SAM enzyme